jgi:hypothetical protein
MMYTKVHKTSFNGQGLTKKDDCFHGLLKDWTAAITKFYAIKCRYITFRALYHLDLRYQIQIN